MRLVLAKLANLLHANLHLAVRAQGSPPPISVSVPVAGGVSAAGGSSEKR
jgi:hypothetical protein